MHNVEIGRRLEEVAQPMWIPIRALSAARPVSVKRRRWATISARNNSTFGDMVAEAVEKVRSAPMEPITIKESKTTRRCSNLFEGQQFDRGFISPYFITHPERQREGAAFTP